MTADHRQLQLVLCLTVVTEDPSTLSRTSEILARTATGLALDGVNGTLTLAQANLDPEVETVGDADE